MASSPKKFIQAVILAVSKLNQLQVFEKYSPHLTKLNEVILWYQKRFKKPEKKLPPTLLPDGFKRDSIYTKRTDVIDTPSAIRRYLGAVLNPKKVDENPTIIPPGYKEETFDIRGTPRCGEVRKRIVKEQPLTEGKCPNSDQNCS